MNANRILAKRAEKIGDKFDAELGGKIGAALAKLRIGSLTDVIYSLVREAFIAGYDRAIVDCNSMLLSPEDEAALKRYCHGCTCKGRKTILPEDWPSQYCAECRPLRKDAQWHVHRVKEEAAQKTAETMRSIREIAQ